MLAPEASARGPPLLALPDPVLLALSRLLCKERAVWLAAPLASTALHAALQTLAKAPAELERHTALLRVHRSPVSSASSSGVVSASHGAAAAVLARCHAHLVSARTLVHALRGDARSRGVARAQDQGSEEGSAEDDDDGNESLSEGVGAAEGLGEGRASRVLAQVLESRDGDPPGAWILHVRLPCVVVERRESCWPGRWTSFSRSLSLSLAHALSRSHSLFFSLSFYLLLVHALIVFFPVCDPRYTALAQMSLEVLKAWQAASPQAWPATRPGASQALLEVHVGLVELLEVVAHTVGTQAFSDLLFLRFPTASPHC